MAIKLTGFIFLFESSGIYCLISRHWTTWQGSRHLRGTSSCSAARVLSSRHPPSCLLSDMSSQVPTTVSATCSCPSDIWPLRPTPFNHPKQLQIFPEHLLWAVLYNRRKAKYTEASFSHLVQSPPLWQPSLLPLYKSALLTILVSCWLPTHPQDTAEPALLYSTRSCLLTPSCPSLPSHVTLIHQQVFWLGMCDLPETPLTLMLILDSCIPRRRWQLPMTASPASSCRLTPTTSESVFNQQRRMLLVTVPHSWRGCGSHMVTPQAIKKPQQAAVSNQRKMDTLAKIIPGSGSQCPKGR